MKLYAWKYRGYGLPSYFVVAPSENEARAAILNEIERDRDNFPGLSKWPEGYELIVAEPGTVVTNENQ